METIIVPATQSWYKKIHGITYNSLSETYKALHKY